MSKILDILGIGGAGLVVYGVWLIHAPTSVIVAGLGMVAVAILGAKRWA